MSYNSISKEKHVVNCQMFAQYSVAAAVGPLDRLNIKFHMNKKLSGVSTAVHYITIIVRASL